MISNIRQAVDGSLDVGGWGFVRKTFMDRTTGVASGMEEVYGASFIVRPPGGTGVPMGTLRT